MTARRVVLGPDGAPMRALVGFRESREFVPDPSEKDVTGGHLGPDGDGWGEWRRRGGGEGGPRHQAPFAGRDRRGR